ncbi:S8 family peptidase [Microseira wollei]|uniref:Peptidase S8 and S53, subtilisin, kexin, sedolisin n=1 Tax=Microseira wollei NIES-4236 TaxID=2530354 RepID=A0AAV3X4I9_9CYAN|nr:S8 family peptidase [Microseira wollei]GET37024.1 peptidase S8 and S53, subtilisin, kexin, sedolisin [Microseira wollei NIES-4236]
MSNQPIALENLFDADFYRANNPDLRNFDNQRALQHWRDYGLAEGRVFSPLVDLKFYRNRNGDLSHLSNRQLLEHLANFGLNEGRDFSPIVNLNYYRARNSDLARFNFSNRQLFDHLVNFGLNEGRSFSPFVNLNFYRDSNPDLANQTHRQRFNHLLTFGVEEARAFSPFIDLNFYRATNPDLVNLSNRQLFNHLIDWGINEGRIFSPFLDINFYRASNGDLASFNNRQLWEHFQSYGFFEGRSFSPIPYSASIGYGLVNASAAVAAAIGQSPFSDVPNLGGNNWNLDMVKAPEAWSKGYTGQGIVVAVVDSGVDYTHPDLDNNIWINTKEITGNGVDDDRNGFVDDVRGWNFADSNNNPMDFYYHGTHIAGIIAAENNEFGMTGVAFNAKIMPVKVYNGANGGYGVNVAAGIRYAADNGANVINLSMGNDITNDPVTQAIRYAIGKGTVVILSSGNDGDIVPDYPARYATHFGIAVGSVDRNNNMSWISNRAGTTRLDYVTAPGVDIYSTFPLSRYGTKTGTSYAAPHVSGVAALILSANPNLSPVQVERIITANANSNRSGFSLANSTNQSQEVAALSASFDSVTGDLIEPESNNLRSSDRIHNTSVVDVVETAIPAESFANASPTLPFNSIPIDAGMTQKSNRVAEFFEPNSLDAISPMFAQMQPNLGTDFLPRLDISVA